MKLNVIIPLYNEEECLKDFYDEISSTLKDVDYLLTFIDDGSTDNSLKILKELYKFNKNRIKVISFSRNFGKDAAMYAGIKNSISEYTAIIDADLQQSPEYLLNMINTLDKEQNTDSVCMIQSQKNKRFFQNLFYKLINKFSKTNFVNGASDFRMFRKNVNDSIILMSEKNRFSKGLFSWIGFNTKYLPYKVNPRAKGKSKWNFFKLFKYATNGIVDFSTSPLKLATFSGILTSLSAFIYLIVLIIKTIIYGKDVPGYASIMCVVLFIGGIQLLCIGALGEYLSRTYIESKNRPIYIEKEKLGYEDTIL